MKKIKNKSVDAKSSKNEWKKRSLKNKDKINDRESVIKFKLCWLWAIGININAIDREMRTCEWEYFTSSKKFFFWSVGINFLSSSYAIKKIFIIVVIFKYLW